MAITWNPKLSTGIDWQDEEHKELFARIDALLDAMRHSHARSSLDGLFEFLESYVIRHFGREEDLMTELDYPEMMAHGLQHAIFRESIREIQRDFVQQGGSTYVVMRIQRLLAEWFMRHIIQVDRRLAAFVLSKTPA
jgi:hemerythrin